MKFTYKDFEKLVEDENITDIHLVQDTKVRVVCVEERDEYGRPKIFKEKVLEDYGILEEKECNEIVLELVNKHNLNIEEHSICVNTENYRLVIASPKICNNGWNIVLRKLVFKWSEM